MNCATCQSLLLDYLEGALHAEATRQVEAHAAACPVCRMELALAQKIESALSGQELRMPPADFTSRVLAALPAVRTVGETFWSQMLSPLAYAASILALIFGLSQSLPPLWRLSEAWSDWTARLAPIPGLGWPESSAAPGRLAIFFRAAQEVVGDTLSATTAYGAQLQGLYSANASTVNLTLAVLALLWVVYDYWQEAKA
jgi:anti-sigma factor RsiW